MITTLQLLDEVNCKFTNLSPECRRAMIKELEYFVPGSQYSAAYKLGRWNGKMSFFDLAGRTYINLLDRILPITEQYGYEVEIEDLRESNSNFSFDEVKEDSYSHVKWPEGHPIAGQPILLKDHQVEVINTCLSNLAGVQVSPTGSGKTLICAILSHKIEPYGRSIVIVPTKDLVVQTEEDYINMGLDVGVFFGDRKEYNRTHTICTWQSLERLNKRSKEIDLEVDITAFFEGVVCVMVDECFHPDALVLTSLGYLKISDIKVGDKIINYSEKDNRFKEDTVVNVFRNLTKSSNERMYELEFDNGKKIKVTGNHRFLTQRGWVRADQLNDDDDIKSINT